MNIFFWRKKGKIYKIGNSKITCRDYTTFGDIEAFGNNPAPRDLFEYFMKEIVLEWKGNKPESFEKMGIQDFTLLMDSWSNDMFLLDDDLKGS